MQRVMGIIATFFILTLVIIACESEITPTSLHSPTLEPATQEASPPSHVETPVPFSPTFAPTPDPTQTRPGLGFFYETISAPVTPDSPASAYELVSWTEEEWLAAIVEARAFATELTENWGSNDFIYGYYGLRMHLMMMEKEALLRYPDTLAYSDIAWDLAYGESISVNYIEQYDVDLLISLLENGLNSGAFTLETLTSELSRRGFKVIDIFESANLFGAGHSGIVMHIDSYNPRLASDGEAAAFIAIGGTGPGNFRVEAVKQLWDFNYHSTKTMSVTDLNKNGVDEVFIVNDYWGGVTPRGCASGLSMYEWRGNHPNGRFENVAANVSDVVVGGGTGDCERPWEFEDENVIDLPVIKAYRRLYITVSWEDCPRYEAWTLYVWNGQVYEWRSEGVNLIVSPPKCSIGWASIAGGLNDEAVRIVETALLDWPSEMNDTWGPASEDYFRFKLGTWYALRGENELATEMLESVRDQPRNPDFGKASELAALYLANYEQQDLNAACQAVRENILDDLLLSQPGCCSYDTASMQETWGFANPQWTYFIADLCEWDAPSSQPTNTSTPQPEVWTSAEQELAIIQIEQVLFEAGDFIQAKISLNGLLTKNLFDSSGSKNLIKAYLTYLLALTNELSGDEVTAVNLYWQLWHDYPDSPYALNARRKLEHIE